MMQLSADQLARGGTALSTGNHAIAVAHAARELGTTAKVVMPRTADPARIEMAREQGAEVVLAEDMHAAAARTQVIERGEGRFLIGAPFALPYSFALCRENLDGPVLVTDDPLRDAMRLLFSGAKLAAEPAGAAAAAALLGSLRETLSGKRVILIVCGANLSAAAYVRLLSEGPA